MLGEGHPGSLVGNVLLLLKELKIKGTKKDTKPRIATSTLLDWRQLKIQF